MQEHIPNPKFMVLAETSTFGIFLGRNVCGRNVLAETSLAEMSMAEMSEHRAVTRNPFLHGALRPAQYNKSPRFRPFLCKTIKSVDAFSILYSTLRKACVFIDFYNDLVCITILIVDCVAV